MKMQSVVSGLVGGAVLMVAGVAVSGNTATCSARVLNFDRTKGELWAAAEQQAAKVYATQASTSFEAANLALFEPPNPCFELATAWNAVVASDQKNNTKSTVVYSLLLGGASELACRVRLTAVAGSSPQPLVSVQLTQ